MEKKKYEKPVLEPLSLFFEGGILADSNQVIQFTLDQTNIEEENWFDGGELGSFTFD